MCYNAEIESFSDFPDAEPTSCVMVTVAVSLNM